MDLGRLWLTLWWIRASLSLPLTPTGSFELLPTGSKGSGGMWLASFESDKQTVCLIIFQDFFFSTNALTRLTLTCIWVVVCYFHVHCLSIIVAKVPWSHQDKENTFLVKRCTIKCPHSSTLHCWTLKLCCIHKNTPWHPTISQKLRSHLALRQISTCLTKVLERESGFLRRTLEGEFPKYERPLSFLRH